MSCAGPWVKLGQSKTWPAGEGEESETEQLGPAGETRPSGLKGEGE